MAELTFAREAFRSIEAELRPLVAAHAQEVKLDGFPIPFNPNWAFYGKQDAAGRLWTFTARDPKFLVGYALYWLGQAPVFRVPQATNEAIFLARPARRGRAGLEFLGFCEHALREHAGIRILQHIEWNHARIGAVLKRRGFTALQTTWWKFL